MKTILCHNVHNWQVLAKLVTFLLLLHVLVAIIAFVVHSYLVMTFFSHFVKCYIYVVIMFINVYQDNREPDIGDQLYCERKPVILALSLKPDYLVALSRDS